MTSHQYQLRVRDIEIYVLYCYFVNVNLSGNGIDYTSTPINATFPVGANSITINVPVTKDTIAEETEAFNLSFSIPSSLSGQVVSGDITTAIGSIADDTSKRELLVIIQ